MDRIPMPQIISLEEICRQYPREEKVFIVPTFSAGRQLLERLAREGTKWTNIRPATSASVAEDMAAEEIAAGEYEILSPLGVQAIVETILAETIGSGEFHYFSAEVASRGCVRAFANAVTDLRMAGVAPGTLDPAHFKGKEKKAADIALVLERYETALLKNRLVDGPELYRLALSSPQLRDFSKNRRVLVLSRCFAQGIEREFIKALCPSHVVVPEGAVSRPEMPRGFWEAGAGTACVTSDVQRLAWLYNSREAPEKICDDRIQIFRATGLRNETREALRRIASAKTAVDDVEIVTTDRDAYTIEIHALCEKLSLPVTFAEGTPWHLRSPARAFMGFLKWIGEDFSRASLARLLESGDLALDSVREKGGPGGVALARALRKISVTRGRGRYPEAIAARMDELKALKAGADRDEDGDEGRTERWDREIFVIECLGALGDSLFKLAPETDDRGHCAFKAMVKGCVDFFRLHTKSKGEEDAAFIDGSLQRLKALERFMPETLPLKSALLLLEEMVEETRTGASGPEPGKLHVSSFHDGGRSGRNTTFVLGLDSSRFPGTILEDPLLLDEEREKLSPELLLARENVRRNLYDLTSLLSGLSGSVTVSYSSYDVLEEKNVYPSPAMLQVLRVREDNPEADYKDLFKALGPPVAYSAGEKPFVALDETDWWMNELSLGNVLLDATNSVEECYPGAKAGRIAKEARESEKFTEYDGKVRPEGDELDPRRNGRAISPTALEQYARCPFDYFMSNVLGARRPDDEIKPPDVWLDNIERGRLLHTVFQKFGEKGKAARQMPPAERLLAARALLTEEIKEYRAAFPPQSEAAFKRESQELEQDVDRFVRIDQEMLGSPLLLEEQFGMGGEKPINVPLAPGESILLKGKIDRIDSVGNHEYCVWDYKTGRGSDIADSAFIKGGEQLQHALYAVAAAEILKERDPGAQITKSGYVFPTERGVRAGKNGVVALAQAGRNEWKDALMLLCELMRRGVFPVSKDAPSHVLGDVDLYGDKDEEAGGNAVISMKTKLKNQSNEELVQWTRLKEFK